MPIPYEEALERLKAKEAYQNQMNQLKETHGDAGVWFSNLQSALNRAGENIDLSSPESLTHFLIIDTKNNNGDFQNEVSYAFDTDGRKFNPNVIQGEDYAKSFSPIPTPRTLFRLYEAAKNGSLVLMNVTGGAEKYHTQIKADGAKVKIGETIRDFTDAEKDVVERFTAPKKPDSPRFGTRFLAAFGNKAAKKRMESYNRSVQRYEKELAKWQKIQKIQKEQPDVYATAMKKAMMDQSFLSNGLDHGIDIYNYTLRARELNGKQKQENLETVKAIQEGQFKQKQKELAELTGQKLTPEIGQQIASKLSVLCTLQKEMAKPDEERLNHGQIPNIVNEAELNKASAMYAKSPEFSNFMKSVSLYGLQEIANAADVDQGLSMIGKLKQETRLDTEKRVTAMEKQYFSELKTTLQSTETSDMYSQFVSAEEKNAPRPYNLGMDFTRRAFDDLSVAMMVCDDHEYPIADIFDPQKLKDVKKEFGKKAIELVNSGDAKTILDYLKKGMQKLSNTLESKVNDLDNLSFATFVNPKYKGINGAATALKGMFQNFNDVLRSEHVKNTFQPEDYPSEEQKKEYDEINFKADKDAHLFKNATTTSQLIDFVNGEDIPSARLAKLIGKVISFKMQDSVFQQMVNDSKNKGVHDVMSMMEQTVDGQKIPSFYGSFFSAENLSVRDDNAVVEIMLTASDPKNVKAARKFVKELLKDEIKLDVKLKGKDSVEESSCPAVHGLRKKLNEYVKEAQADKTAEKNNVQQVKLP